MSLITERCTNTFPFMVFGTHEGKTSPKEGIFFEVKPDAYCMCTIELGKEETYTLPWGTMRYVLDFCGELYDDALSPKEQIIADVMPIVVRHLHPEQ